MSAKSPARSAGPPSSPRLPSPPPLPELQLGPRSPSINATGGELSVEESAAQDEGAARRIRPGTSAADMARGPPFVPLHQVDSPFQLQEYLKSSYCDVTRDDNSDTVKPITKESAMQLATPPIQQDTGDPVDRNLWLYELCRFLVQRTNRLIVSFFADNPPCSSQTCPEMRASEWQYLCAVHEPPKSCCAIDYCCHTLDWAANVLTSPKHFPSRMSLGGEGGSAYQSMRQLTNIFRRVYRIYAHAWFQHREAFWSLEQEEGLYKFFRTVCDAYSLIPEDNYTIPAEAEAEREELIDTPVVQRGSGPPQILKHEELAPQPESEETTILSTGPTVRRHGHRHTPSTGTHVTMIAEGPEEEEEVPPESITNKSLKIQPESITALSEQITAAPLPLNNISTTEPPPRSPRPTMSIPINDNKEDLRAPEDPTPTPERHASDPFSDSPSLQPAQETVEEVSSEDSPTHPESKTIEWEPTMSDEPATPLTATIDRSKGYDQGFPLLRAAVPQLNMQMPSRHFQEDEEVRSPGGGSIRTVGSDILGGILAHVDTDTHEGFKPESTGGAGSSDEKGSEEEPAEPEKEKQPSPELAPEPKPEDEEEKPESPEEMGEIKLVETVIPVNHKEETSSTDVKKEEESNDEDNKKEKEEQESTDEKKDDGTTTEETPAGVV